MIRKIYKKLFHKNSFNLIEFLRNHGAKIGENVHLINSVFDDSSFEMLEIGSNVTITGSRILTHDASTKKFLGYTKIGYVKIGDNVFIGAGSIVLPGTTIGNNVIVGAGTVVAKNIPDNVVVVGNPLRVLCTTEQYLLKEKNNMSKFPVFNSYFNDLSPNEKNKIKEEGRCFAK